MCYSATASFATASFLIPAGFYATYIAYKKQPNYLYLAFVPLFFACQQIMEGLIWLSMNDPTLSFHVFEKIYLFFAFSFWPAYISWSIYYIETNPHKKKLLFSLCILGLFLGMSLYTPLLMNKIALETIPIQHSICYSLNIHQLTINAFSLTYVGILFTATFISSNHKLRLFGVMVFSSFIFTYYCFRYAFASIWCYMAALTSIYLFYVIPRKKIKTEKQFD